MEPRDRDETSETASSITGPANFTRCFEENFASIHRFIARRVGTSLADDLAAETFAIAFRRRATFDATRGSLRAWLYGIANNLIRSHWRSEQHLLDLDARLRHLSHLQDETQSSDEQLAASRVAPRIAAALSALSHEQREVLLLHVWADLTQSEIATALAIAPGTVRSRLSRARATLAAHLGKFDFDLWSFDDLQPSPAQEGTDHA